jgi:hypothetical protein
VVVLGLGLPLGLAGCASSSYEDTAYDQPAAAPRPVVTAGNTTLPQMTGSSRVDSIVGRKPLQCVPYAREHSAIKIFGDANTWWDQALGKYERGASPAIGAVLVLHNYAASNTGHVAVVKRMVGPREIRIDHANWLNDGSIYVNSPVMDVSPANDWSQVRVYNIQTGGWGVKIFPVKGFIGSGSTSANAPAPLTTKPVPRSAPPSIEDEIAPQDAPATDVDALIAEVLGQKPLSKTASIAPARARSVSGLVPVSAGAAELNPPPGSSFALTAEDLAIP